MSETTDRPLGKKLKRGVETKILIPLATAIVSAAASYLLKKLPLVLEKKVLPKLLEKDVPEPVLRAVEQTASTLGADPGAATGGDSKGGQAEQEASESPAADAKATKAEPDMSNDEREEQRREREKRRRERKRTATKAA